MSEKIFVSDDKQAKIKAYGALLAHGYDREEISKGLDAALLKFVQERFAKQEEKSRHVRQMFKRKSDLYETGLRAYTVQNTMDKPYRSARFYHAVESWIDEITESYPSASLLADTYRDRDASEKAKGKEVVLNAMDGKIGIKAIREQIAEDIGKLGTGIEYEYVEEIDGKRIIQTRRADPRCCFPDETATDQAHMNDFTYQEEMAPSTFFKNYQKYTNISEVKWGKPEKEGGVLKLYTKREAEEAKVTVDMCLVRVNHYFNGQFGFRLTFANGVLIFANTIGRIPFTFSYKKKPNDSIWGISAIEETAPEIFALDNLIELGFKNAKNRLQEMIIADGAAGYNHNLKQGSGNMWILPSVPRDKKIQDTFEKISFGTIPPEFFSFRELFLDELTISSQNDQRALMVNPNQLATQTRSKRESFAKRGRRVANGIIWASVKRRWEIRLELLDKYIVPMGQTFHVDGYFILGNDSKNPKFIKDSAGSGVYRLRSQNADVNVEVVVTAAADKSQLQEEEFADLVSVFGQVLQAAQLDQALAEAINWKGFIKAILEKKNVDARDVFKDVADTGIDQIKDDFYRILAGYPAKYPESNDVMELIKMSQGFIELLHTKGMDSQRVNLLVNHITNIGNKIKTICEQDSRNPDEEQGITPEEIQKQQMMAGGQQTQPGQGQPATKQALLPPK